MKNNSTIPVIDLFAGPGGLGEGFSAFQTGGNTNPFKLALSIEKERSAHDTLTLRSFFRQFAGGQAPRDYYDVLKRKICTAELYAKFPQESENAFNEVWKAELGVVSAEEVDLRIRTSLRRIKKWVLIGGPPCQAYSIAGRSRMSKTWKQEPHRKEDDPRHFLYREYLRILAAHKPPIFVMENVRGILSSKVGNENIFQRIRKDLEHPTFVFRNQGNGGVRYRLHSFVKKPAHDHYNHVLLPEDFVIESEKYGIPQARHRVIILGIREDLAIKPHLLRSYHGAVCTKDVIGDLPLLRSGLSREPDTSQRWRNNLAGISLLLDKYEDAMDPAVAEEIKRQVDVLSINLGTGGEFVQRDRQPSGLYYRRWFLDGRLRGVCNHKSRSHMASDILRYLFAACHAKVKGISPKLNEFPYFLLPAHRNVDDGINKGHFNDRFRVQVADQPATTVTSHLHKDGHYYIHPDPAQARSLTVREAARLQTFPDNYLFTGTRTEQYLQVGNAVPPLLAVQLAEVVYRIFSE